MSRNPDELMSPAPAWPALCFWHPVGAHVGESLSEIVRRKKDEISSSGYTLWSFAPGKLEKVLAWRALLEARGIGKTVAICCGDNTVDPAPAGTSAIWARDLSDDLKGWVPLPTPRMTSYHRPAPEGRPLASAFLVTSIEEGDALHVETPRGWYRAGDEKCEREASLPTRGEYLVEPPAQKPKGRPVRVILTVEAPFVVWVR